MRLKSIVLKIANVYLVLPLLDFEASNLNDNLTGSYSTNV